MIIKVRKSNRRNICIYSICNCVITNFDFKTLLHKAFFQTVRIFACGASARLEQIAWENRDFRVRLLMPSARKNKKPKKKFQK